MTDKLISIIVPIYNVEKYLPKCLDSVINQTYENLEIICVIDGSPDNSLQICMEYAEKDKRIIVIEQENQGLSGARNTGIATATGDYIIFVDADDWIELDTCEKALKSMEQFDSDVVIWSYVREFSGSSKPKDIFKMESRGFSEEETKGVYRCFFGLFEEELSIPENADSIVTVWGKLYKRYVVEKIEFVDSKILATSEDLLFNIYAFSRVRKISYINERLNHYRKDNGDSITSNYNHNLFDHWQFLFDEMISVIEKNHLDGDFMTALNNRIALSIIGLGLNELYNPKGSISIIKRIKEIISSKRYRMAYKNLSLKYFPIHWKVFFLFAKMNFATGVYVLLVVMKKLIGK